MTSKPSRWFVAAGVAAVAFVLTIFVMIAGLFSDPELPLNLWMDKNGLPLLGFEVGSVVLFSLLAMFTDSASSTEIFTHASDDEGADDGGD